MRSHAIQISTSLYRIMTSEPTQLVVECYSGTNITTIQGIHLLQLTKECPKASTAEYLFFQTPDMIGYHEINQLPLLSQAKEWLGTIAMEVGLMAGLSTIDPSSSSTLSISLPEFRQRVKDSSRTLYFQVERYMLSVALYGALIGTFVFGAIFIIRPGGKWCSCHKSTHPTLPVSMSNARSISNSNPTVSLPSSVLKQFE